MNYPSRFKANIDFRPIVLPTSPNCYESLTHAKNRLERQEMAGGKGKIEIQSSAERQSPGLVSFVPAVAYRFCLALPAAFMQPGDYLLDIPCTLEEGGLCKSAKKGRMRVRPKSGRRTTTTTLKLHLISNFRFLPSLLTFLTCTLLFCEYVTTQLSVIFILTACDY